MPHVLVVGRIHNAGLAVLRSRPGLTFHMMLSTTEPEIIAQAPDADAILVRTARLSAATLDAAPRLRIVSRHGVGYDNIDLAALDRRNIPLTLVGNVNALSVAEHALFMMLALAKRCVAYDRATRDGNWNIRDSFGATELAGKKLLLLGFGRVGREVTRRAQAFGMTVLAYDPFVRPEAMYAARVQPVIELRTALADADFVSVHLPLTPETKGIIDAEALAGMKKSAIVISTARGGIVDETALAAALKAGTIRGAGLDVYDTEPPPSGDPLLKLDNVLLSPHSAGLTEECAIRMAEVSARNVLAGLDKKLDPELVVNKQTLGAK